MSDLVSAPTKKINKNKNKNLEKEHDNPNVKHVEGAHTKLMITPFF